MDMTRRDALMTATASSLAGLTPSGSAPQVQAGLGGIPGSPGATLVVQTRGRSLANPIVLGDFHFETQGSRLFLVGVRQPCSRHQPCWTDVARCCIAWDAVEEYMIFDSLTDYHDRLALPDTAEPEADPEDDGWPDD